MLHSTHRPELAKRKLGSELEKYRQLVLALLGSLYRYHRGLHTRSTPRIQDRLRRHHLIPLPSQLG